MRSLAVLCILAANIIGGLTYLGQDLALRGLPYGTITLGRNLLAVLLLGILLSASGGIRWRYPPADLARLALIGLVAYGLPLLLGTIGTELSTAANGSILILIEPTAILLFAFLLLGETIRRGQLVGIALGMLGGLVIVLHDAPADGLLAGDHLLGNLLLVLHALLWGLYSPLMRPLAQRYRPMDLTFMSMLLALLLLVPAALVETDQWQAGPQLAPALGWVLALGIGGSFAGTLLWNMSLEHLKASTVAPFVFFQPLAGVLGDYVVHGRSISQAALLGGGFIAAGVLLVIIPARRRSVAPDG